MNQKDIIISIIIIVFAGAGAYFVLNRQAQQAPIPTPTPNPEAPQAGPITVNGEITCLPKKGAGQQTLECAIGLKGSDGMYYGLENLFKLDPEHKYSAGGLQVEVSGTFSPEEMKGPGGSKYDVIGVIDVTSIKKVTSGRPPIVDHFACSDNCPGPRETYMVRVYQGVTDPEECKMLGGRFSSYYGWGKFDICIAQ